MKEGGRRSKAMARLREAGFVLLLCVLGYAHYGWAIEPIRQPIASDEPAPASAIDERKPPHEPAEANQAEPADHDFWGQIRPRFDIPFTPPDAYPNTGEGAENGEKEASEDWGNLSDEWMVYLTGGMFVLALGQLCLFGWQMYLMSNGMKDAEMALNIAKQSANAATGTVAIMHKSLSVSMASHIPNVDIVGMTIGLEDVEHVELPDKVWKISRINLKFRNTGNGTAFAYRICVLAKIAADLPEKPVYSGVEIVRNSIYAIQREVDWVYPFDLLQHDLTDDDLEAVRKYQKRLWVYGFLETDDVFDRPYTLGFIAVWTGNDRGFSIFSDQHESQYSYYRYPEDAG